MKKIKSLFPDKRKNIINLVFSAVFSVCITAGRQLENHGSVSFFHPAALTALIIICTGVFFVMSIADRHFEKICIHPDNNPEKKEVPKKMFFLTWGAFIVSYIPVLLASWPGFFCYDAETESYEVFTFKYSNHHPIMHELLLGNILRLGNKVFGSYNAGITIFVIMQMIVMSCIFAYLLTTLYRYGAGRIRLIVSFVFLAFFPTVQMFMVCTAKDVLFTGGIILFITLLIRTLHEKTSPFLLFISVCMMLFFRNNGIYILPVFCVLVFILEKRLRRILPVMIAGIVFYLIITQALIAFLPVKRGEKGEMLSVPMQQLARVHMLGKDAFTDEDLEILYSMIPEVILENYNPKLADNIKVNFLEDNFKADPGKYASLWVRTFFKKPGLYLDAFGIMTDGYWYLSAPVTGYEGYKVGNELYGESAYFQFMIETPGTSEPLLKGLNGFYKSLSLDIKWQRIPVLSLILLPSFYIWLFAFSYAGILKEKKNAFRTVFWIPALLFLTMLLGPIALVRYALPFYLMVPVFLAPEVLKDVSQ